MVAKLENELEETRKAARLQTAGGCWTPKVGKPGLQHVWKPDSDPTQYALGIMSTSMPAKTDRELRIAPH